MKDVERKKKDVLYVKKGSKYVPANDPWAREGLREGWWIIGVGKSVTTIRQCIYPDKAELQAACMIAEDKLIKIIEKAISPVEKLGDMYIYASRSDQARTILNELLKAVNERELL